MDVLYTAVAEDNYMDAALIAALQLHTDEPPGDILVFLTGQDEIESLERLLSEKAGAPAAHKLLQQQRQLLQQQQNGGVLEGENQPAADGDKVAGKTGSTGLRLMTVPIYSSMPPEQQMKVCMTDVRFSIQYCNVSVGLSLG